MNQKQWETLKKCASFQTMDRTPVSLIVDSPWIPGYCEISTVDYFTLPDVWLAANLKVVHDFPDLIFLPGFWVEYGMANEPSAFGSKISFYENKTPNANALFHEAEAIDSLTLPNPRIDGLMPFVTNLYKKMEPRVNDAGYIIKIVAARGPMAIATHLMGLTEFLTCLKLDPERTHQLLKITTATIINWLNAQADALTSPEGIMVLDDITGFLSEPDYLEFAQPYLKEIFNAFPGSLKILHNDTDNVVPFKYISDLGVNIFNFTHLKAIDRVRELVGDGVCLMGNIPPLEVLTNGTVKMVHDEARKCLNLYGNKPGLILSAGGGASPGTPGINIRALLDAI